MKQIDKIFGKPHVFEVFLFLIRNLIFAVEYANAVGWGREDAVELFFTVTFWMVSNCRKINLSKIGCCRIKHERNFDGKILQKKKSLTL